MKLYSVCDGPPSLACQMTLKHLNIPFELVEVNFNVGEHLTDEYAKLNPQKEIPVLEDNGFLISEHIAIMQYLCDKYAPESKVYPKDPQMRGLVNHRMCYNMVRDNKIKVDQVNLTLIILFSGSLVFGNRSLHLGTDIFRGNFQHFWFGLK